MRESKGKSNNWVIGCKDGGMIMTVATHIHQPRSRDYAKGNMVERYKEAASR